MICGAWGSRNCICRRCLTAGMCGFETGDVSLTPPPLPHLPAFSFRCGSVAYVFSLKVLAPDRVVLLRGNHEFGNINGDVELYGATSFLSQVR